MKCRKIDNISFIVDEMLGRTARWLRILGFDTEWAGELRKNNEALDIDTRIIYVALMQNRILITRDKQLAQRAERYGVQTIILPANMNLLDRLTYIVYKIKEYGVSSLPCISRCPLCNGELLQIDKRYVKKRVPLGTYQKHKEFWICAKCGKIYWKGSHWSNIDIIKKVLSKNLEG